MNLLRDSDDYEPLARVNGFPVYATSLLVVAHCLALIACWTAASFGFGAVLERLQFSSTAVLEQGAVWQWFTYLWVEPVANPLFFAIEMFLLYAFGREVERSLGRRHYLLLYGLLVITAPLLLTVVGLITPLSLAGSGAVHFAIFFGFALLYPGAEFFFRIRAIWLAGVLLALYGIYYLTIHQWAPLLALASGALTVWLFLQWERSEGLFAPVEEPLQPPPLTRDDPVQAIDPLLEKITREGMASLTAKELDALEKAREELLSRQEKR